jgi:hypothetical protein
MNPPTTAATPVSWAAQKGTNPMPAIDTPPTPPSSDLTPEQLRISTWLDGMVTLANRTKVIAKVTNLTPDLATVLLSRNPSNRNISPAKVEKMTRDLLLGNWQLNGESITVSDDGLLNDGQHRCQMVVNTGQTISLILVVGPTRKSRFTNGDTLPKTNGNYLQMQDVSNGTTAAAVARLVWQFENFGNVNSNFANNYRPTKVELTQAYLAHPDISTSILRVPSKGSGILGSRSLLAFCHYMIAAEAGLDPATDFMTDLREGVGLQRGDPVLYVRNKLLNDPRGHMTTGDRIELIIRAWNARRLGRDDVHRFMLSGNGNLPKIEG